MTDDTARGYSDAHPDEGGSTDASVRGHAEQYRADAQWVERHALHLVS